MKICDIKKVKLWAITLASMLISCHAYAANILVLTTAEGPSDGVTMNNNCLSEFTALRPTHTVVTLPGKLNDNVAPLTAQDLTPSTGPYDIVVTCTVYASANPQAIAVISNGMQQRTARAFFNFDERQSFMPAFAAAKNDWSLALGPIFGGSGVSQLLNTRSIYAAAFSGLAVMGGHSYGTYTGAPIDNTLYTPQNAPIPPASNVVPGASTIVVPIEQSYLDANGTPQGACLFQSTDVSMFDSVRYAANRGKISTAFINATAPGGACSLSPSISKSFSPSSVVAGGTSTLTIRINNNGGYTDSAGVFQPGAAVSALKVHDNLPFPLQLASTPTTTCTGGTVTGGLGQNSLALDGSSLPPGGCTITATVVWPVSAAASCTNTAVINTIDAGVDFTTASGTAQQNATASLACPPIASIQVSKSVEETSVMTGATAHFTVSVSNAGPVAGSGIIVNDFVTSEWSSSTWNCSASGGAVCPEVSGTGNITLNNLALPAGGALSYAVASVTSGSGNSATNTVSVNPGDGKCSTGATTCSAFATVAVHGGVQISKARNSAQSAKVGDSVQYTVQVSNPTGVAMTQPIVIADPLPTGLESGTWACTGACGDNLNGTMPLATSLVSLAPLSSATFTISAVISASAQGTSIVNTATVTPSAPEQCIDGQNHCSASADAVQVTSIASGSPAPVPYLSQWALVILSLLLAGVAKIGLRRITK